MQEYIRSQMPVQRNEPKLPLRLNWVTFGYLFYMILLYVLSIYIWSQNRSEEFLTYNYLVNIDEAKLIVSIILSITMWYIVTLKYYKADNFSTQVMLLLILLYFMPGVVLSGVLNFEWTYLIEYYMYFVVMIVADKLVGKPKGPFFAFENKSLVFLQKFLIIISLLLPFFFAFYFRSSFSISEIILTLNDPYGTRIAAREANTRWLILAIEYWGAYFSCFMITYSLKNKKIALAVAYILCELFYFTLQGNRIFVFYIGIAIVLGVFKCNNRILTTGFVVLLLAQLIEHLLIPDPTSVGLITNIFRRFCVVPNIISTQYFDFFKTHSPDWLTGTFTGLFGLLGIKSKYGSNVGYLIGSTYYGWRMNANNGLFGGALFEFGTLGIFIDSIMFVLVLRLIEKLMFNSDRELKLITATVYASLAINLTTIWAGMFRLTPTLLFILSCMVFCHNYNGEIDE